MQAFRFWAKCQPMRGESVSNSTTNRRLACLIVACLCSPIAFAADPLRLEQSQSYEPTTSYRTLTINGFEVRLSSKVIAHGKDSSEQVVTRLREGLLGTEKLMPCGHFQSLKCTVMWIEWNSNVNVDMPRDTGYHAIVSKSLFLSRQINPDKRGGIEINAYSRLYGKPADWTIECAPCWLLHELAHAYHDRILGVDNERVLKAYNQAV
jgi:hypothetical protein